MNKTDDQQASISKSTLLVVFLCLFSVTDSYASSQDSLQFSGFARAIVGHLDDENAEYVGYDNSLSLDQQSLLGLQADYSLTDSISVTAQVVGYTEDQRNSGLQWLYLSYAPNNALQIKLGKLRIPFFNYSDSLDIGFAYPWLTLPQQVYDTAFFSTFEGVLANYGFSLNNWLVDFEAYWGYYDDKIYLASQEIDTKVDGLFGANATVNIENFTLRASYNQGDAEVAQDEASLFAEQLRLLGFSTNADWLNANGIIRFYQFSANYENLNYFVRGEVTKMVSEAGLVADIDSFFISLGYNFHPYTLYISYSEKDLHFEHASNEIPFGVSDELDFLAATYMGVIAAFPDDQATGTKLGLRWDWRPNLAFKAEMTFVNANDKVSNDYAVKDLGGFDGQTVLYQVGAEWVF